MLNPAPNLKTSASVTVLATPTLKLTEPSLMGKAEPGTTSAPAIAPANNDNTDQGIASSSIDSGDSSKPDNRLVKLVATCDNADDRPTGDRKRDDKTLVVTAAAASDARTDAPAATAIPPQAARVDAVAPRVVQAGYQTSQQQLNLPQLAFELARQVTDGNTLFHMRLDPPELDRIDVKLNIDNSGQINARLVVEKSEILDLMQRD
ncbi:MAG: flagellar hook-length control protein FliK [Candidatus Devosia symbiotica]|nr:flagellar hook-length control protein FliK [Candidatus Devosia symbiotica]